MTGEKRSPAFPSLDALEALVPPGTRFRFQAGTTTRLGMVHGYVHAIPAEAGGPKEPALVVETDTGIGCVYPWEVVLPVDLAAKLAASMRTRS